MPSPTAVQAEFPSKIDSSILSTFDSCKQKFFNQYILGLTPQAKSPDLLAGGAIARGLEVTRNAFWVDKLPQDEAVHLGIWAISDFWGDADPEPEKRGKPHIKSFINTVAAFHSYFEEYPLDKDKIKPHYYADGKPAVEFSYAIEMDAKHPVTGDPLLFAGRCDLVGYYHDFFCVIDEKTTTSLGAAWPEQWVMRGQFLGYCFAAQQFGLDIKTALVRGIAFQVKEIKHMEALVQFGQWQIDRWWHEANIKAQQMVDIWNASNMPGVDMSDEWHHSYGDACGSYGGCSFRGDLCTSHKPTDWYSNYDVQRWDPLKKDPSIPVVVGGLEK